MSLVITPPALDKDLLELVAIAVREDLGSAASHGDKTVELSIPADLRASARIVARAPGTAAGTNLLPAICSHYAFDSASRITPSVPDGARVTKNQTVAEFHNCPARALLSAERVLLNFLSHLSGIATMTRRYVDAVAPIADRNGGRPAICDTRKTTPAFRTLDKYAVRCGGGTNHRMGLYDGVMLKDNHLAALRKRMGAGTLAQLAARVRADLDEKITLWLEVDTLEQLSDALHGDPGDGADIILLDNFSADALRRAVELRDAARSKTLLEASGGITLENLVAVAATGVDRISIGALTHSAPILDLSMEFVT